MTEKLNFSINDNNEIIETNFFNTTFHEQGLCYLYNYEGCFHFFIPKKHEDKIEEMKTGKYAVLTMGYHTELKKIMAEIMFEDNTSTPWSFWISQCQMNCEIDSSFNNKRMKLKCYSQKGKVFEWDIFIRCVDQYQLPYLQPLGFYQMIRCYLNIE